MPIIHLIKERDGFTYSLPEDLEKMRSFKEGSIVRANIEKPRNAAFHRKFFALLNVVLDHTDYDNTDQILHLLKLKLGYYDLIVNTNGKNVYMPRSIKFASMDNAEFTKFYNESIDIILKDFLIDWDNERITTTVEMILRKFI